MYSEEVWQEMGDVRGTIRRQGHQIAELAAQVLALNEEVAALQRRMIPRGQWFTQDEPPPPEWEEEAAYDADRLPGEWRVWIPEPEVAHVGA